MPCLVKMVLYAASPPPPPPLMQKYGIALRASDNFIAIRL